MYTRLVDRTGIRDLRADAAAIVRRAGSGERVIITVAGRPVAQLGPLDPLAGAPTIDDLVARGLLLAPRRTDRPSPSDPVPTFSATRLDRLLRDVR
jgi:prevent-host-death family protein